MRIALMEAGKVHLTGFLACRIHELLCGRHSQRHPVSAWRDAEWNHRSRESDLEFCDEEEKTKLGIFNERPLTGAGVAVGGLL